MGRREAQRKAANAGLVSKDSLLVLFWTGRVKDSSLQKFLFPKCTQLLNYGSVNNAEHKAQDTSQGKAALLGEREPLTRFPPEQIRSGLYSTHRLLQRHTQLPSFAWFCQCKVLSARSLDFECAPLLNPTTHPDQTNFGFHFVDQQQFSVLPS